MPGEVAERVGAVPLKGTTDGAGAAEVTTRDIRYGKVLAVICDGTNLTAGADLDVVPVYVDVDGAELEGAPIVQNADVSGAAMVELYPRATAQTIAGAAHASGDAVPFVIAAAKLRAKIANGGAAVDFAVWVVIEV